MAQTFNRICIKEQTFTDRDEWGDPVTFTLQRGKEYTTSPERHGQVRVYSTWWFWAPAVLFAGAEQFTPADAPRTEGSR